MQSIIESEKALSFVRWMGAGLWPSRARAYSMNFEKPIDETITNLSKLVSPHRLLGSTVSSFGIGKEMTAGAVVGNRFSVSRYAPLDNSVLPLSRVLVEGELRSKLPDRTEWTILIRPRSAGIWGWILVCAVSALVCVFVALQLASKGYWESIGITISIGFGVVLLDSLILFWSAVGARENEYQLLQDLEVCAGNTAEPDGVG
jgi:hypothetical protein